MMQRKTWKRVQDVDKHLIPDRERRAAGSVRAMRQVMQDCGHLGYEHLRKAIVCNLLSPDATRLVLTVEEVRVLDQADDEGRQVFGLHASHLFGSDIGRITADEIDKHFNGKYLTGKWTKKFARWPSTVMKTVAATTIRIRRGRKGRSAAQPDLFPV